MVSITWRKIALWRGATLREAMTFNWMEGYCQIKMTPERGIWRVNILTTHLSLCPILPSSIHMGSQLAQPNRKAKGMGAGMFNVLYSRPHCGAKRHSIEVGRVKWEEQTKGMENVRKLLGFSLYVHTCLFFQDLSNVCFNLASSIRKVVSGRRISILCFLCQTCLRGSPGPHPVLQDSLLFEVGRHFINEQGKQS